MRHVCQIFGECALALEDLGPTFALLCAMDALGGHLSVLHGEVVFIRVLERGLLLQYTDGVLLAVEVFGALQLDRTAQCTAAAGASRT